MDLRTVCRPCECRSSTSVLLRLLKTGVFAWLAVVSGRERTEGASAFTPTGSMKVARATHAATSLANGNVLVAGGGDNTAEIYDYASGTWSLTGAMSAPRALFATVLLPDGKVLAVGGLPLGPSGKVTELYDPLQGKWAVTGPLDVSNGSYTTAALLGNGKVLALGTSFSTGSLYDIAQGTWGPTTLMSGRYENATVLLSDGRVLAATGFIRAVGTTTAEIYDPLSGQWNSTGSLNQAYQNPSSVLLQDGRVLLCGGGMAEIYDPQSGQWSVTAPMSFGRIFNTLTLLGNGKVLATGSVEQGLAQTIAELYDPATGLWTRAGTMTTARGGSTASLLPDGKVLIAGGASTGDTKSAELYDPSVPPQPSSPPLLTQDLADSYVLEGGAVTLQVKTSYPEYHSYQWLRISDQGVARLAIDGMNGGGDTITVPSVTSTTRFQVMVTGTNGTTKSRIATVTVIPQSTLVTWHSTPIAAPAYLPTMVVQGNGILAGSDGLSWAASTTGETWTAATSSPPAGVTMNSLAFGNGVFVSVGNFGRVYTSTDGINWTWRDISAPTLNLRKVIFGGDQFVVIGGGRDGATTSETLLTSPDGITWTSTALPAASTFASTAGASSVYSNVAVGNHLLLCVFFTPNTTWTIVSPNWGQTWTAKSSSVYAPSLAFGNGTFVREDATSTDGLTWTARGTRYQNIGFTGGLFTAEANTDFNIYPMPMPPVTAVWISSDGVVWTKIANGLAGASLGPVQATNGGLLMFGYTMTGSMVSVPTLYYTGSLPPLMPGITRQPASLTVTPRQAVQLYSQGSGGGVLAYQWYAGASGDVSHPVAGATASSFTPTPLAATASYWVRVSNSAGHADSSTATVTISNQFIQGGGSITTGQPVTFRYNDDFTFHNTDITDPYYHIIFASLPVTYQWQRNQADLPGQTSSTLSLVDLHPSDSGNYRLVLTNAAGSLASEEKTLTVTDLAPTLITTQPASTTIDAGQSANLSVQATGAGSVTYQWYAGQTGDVSHPVATATSAVVTVTPSSTTSYWARATSSSGHADSNAATVTVSQPVMAPMFQQQPSGTTVSSSQSFTLQALATGQGTISYQWFQGNAGDVSHPIVGATGSLWGSGPIPATRNYWVRASNSGGHVDSVTVTVTVTSPPPVILTPAFSLGGVNWMVAREVHASVSAEGATLFQVDGLPAGLVLNKFTGSVSGIARTAGAYHLRIIARNATKTSDPLLVTVMVAPLSPNVLGNFAGLIERDLAVNNSLGGRFSLAMASTGLYTGTYTRGGVVQPFKGAVSLVGDDGSVHGVVGPMMSKKLQPYLEFVINPADARLTGSVYLMSETEMSSSASLAAVRNIWTGNVKPSAYAGNYSASLLVPPEVAGNLAYPLGTGYFVGSVDMNGGVTMAARLGDNTVVSTSVVLGPDESIPLHWLAYSGTGSAQGWQKLMYTPGNPLGAYIDGNVTWFKQPQPAKSTVRSYKAGIPLHQLTTLGSKILIPAKGQIELGFEDKPENAMAMFTAANLSGEGAMLPVRITTSQTVLIAKGLPLTMTIDKTAGKFLGTCGLDGRLAAYYGIFSPRIGFGIGQFQIPASASPTSPILGGSASLVGQ